MVHLKSEFADVAIVGSKQEMKTHSTVVLRHSAMNQNFQSLLIGSFLDCNLLIGNSLDSELEFASAPPHDGVN